MWGLQKLGMILENKLPPNLKLAQDKINKTCSTIQKIIKEVIKMIFGAISIHLKYSNFLEAYSFY